MKLPDRLRPTSPRPDPDPTTAAGIEASPDAEAPGEGGTDAEARGEGGALAARLRRARRREVGPALEIVALTAFVFARPIFGSFGRSPETFVARGADWTDVVVFALLVALVPPLVLVVGELAVGGVSSRARSVARIGVMVVLTGLVVWQLVEQVADWDSGVGVPVSLLAGALLTFAWLRVPSVGVFLRYASVGLAVFVVQFLALAPTSSIVLGHRHGGVDPAAAGEVAAAVKDGAPPVVLVVMDGLPTELLLDGTGHIDADLYPNFASLAGDATWYRDNTTVAQFTLEAVPAILSGQTPAADDRPAVTGSYEHNLFTLLGDSYDMHVGEQITGLCPVSLCPEPGGSPLGGLSSDAYKVWRAQMADTALDPELVPQAFDDRYERAHDWIAAQDFREGGKPDLFAYHLLLPHAGWQYLPDGSEYAASGRPEGMFYDTWGADGPTVGRQRHVLQAQAADGLLGELLDGLRDAGTYDDAVVVVTADHGYAFTKDAP
ncbi:MAG TPA: sulfatase-like hydrolase/transferase, partial [Acidimicrobiales bacterium]